MKKILYVGLKYNYGKREEGFSYEHMNIEAGILDCVKRGMFDVICSHPDDMKLDIEQLFLREHFDAIFHVAFNESLDLPEGIAKLAIKQDIPVIQWDCDSSWRFQNWIFPRKERVTHFVTTHSATIPWYERNGMRVIKSQWGGSPLYLPDATPTCNIQYQYNVSFIGQKHGQMPNGKFLRSEIIDALESAGIKIDLFGNYWDGYKNWHGYLTDFNDVINVFRTSKINLNLSNPWHYGTLPQIKGRHFEIPQSKGLQISTFADDLQSYFNFGKEIVIANNIDELINSIKYYLDNEEERIEVTNRGYRRMLLEHQWHHRFTHIFKEVGLL